MFVELTVMVGYKGDSRSFEKQVLNMNEARVLRTGKDGLTAIEFRGRPLDVKETPRKILAMLYGSAHLRRLTTPQDE